LSEPSNRHLTVQNRRPMTNSYTITWIVEAEAFSEAYASFCDVITAQGCGLVHWKDEWWESQAFPNFSGSPTLFHGSLGNADRIARELPWWPGAFCATEAFHCSAWYEQAVGWLLPRKWVFTTVRELVANPVSIAGHLAIDGKVFIRPDSPLKPSSGRVRRLNGITLRDLDHGFYYEDEALPIVVSSLAPVEQEWRFIVGAGKIIAASGYEADSRTARNQEGIPWNAAREIIATLEPPESVYVMDLCESDGEIRLVELNPFSGADLYACPPAKVVHGVCAVIQSMRNT
jgi:hypothetical protein